MLDLSASTSRRGWLARLGAAAAALGVSGLVPAGLAGAAPLHAGPDPDPSDKWLDGLTGKHRQIFDMPSPDDGKGLLHIRNYMDTYRTAYKATDKEVNAIGTLYGTSLPMGFQDPMWPKYKFGEALKITDPTTKAPLERNWFAHPKQGDPIAFGFLDSSIESLQGHGVRFIMCNNALNLWVQRLATASGGKPEEIKADLVAHLLPGVVIVPAMVIAINRAQERGFTYMYLG